MAGCRRRMWHWRGRLMVWGCRRSGEGEGRGAEEQESRDGSPAAWCVRRGSPRMGETIETSRKVRGDNPMATIETRQATPDDAQELARMLNIFDGTGATPDQVAARMATCQHVLTTFL